MRTETLQLEQPALSVERIAYRRATIEVII